MKRTTTIVLFASIFAVAVGTLGLSGISTTYLMASAVPQSQEQVGMLGHVEYTLADSSGNIVQYMQSDNTVVNDGEDCAANRLFGTAGCTGGLDADFIYVAIGNHTGQPTPGVLFDTNSTLSDLLDNDTGTCATSSSGSTDFVTDGEMARKVAALTLVSAANGVTGTVVKLDTSGSPFQFDLSNKTTVYDSGLFNANYPSPNDQQTCSGATGGDAGSDWEMFSRQQLNGATGITVSNGDSLSVKWTITVG